MPHPPGVSAVSAADPACGGAAPGLSSDTALAGGKQ